MHQQSRTPEGGGAGGASPPCPFSRGGAGGGKVPFYKVYFINVYMWTEPYHLSIVNIYCQLFVAKLLLLHIDF